VCRAESAKRALSIQSIGVPLGENQAFMRRVWAIARPTRGEVLGVSRPASPPVATETLFKAL